MIRGVDWSKTLPLRADQKPHFERVAARLAALSDDDLYELRMEWGEHVQRLLAGSDGDDIAPVVAAQMALADILVTEVNYRLGVIWEAESQMRGGHRVHVSRDRETVGTYQAVCAPHWFDDDECWQGPERSYVEDAIEDARRHKPGYGPGM